MRALDELCGVCGQMWRHCDCRLQPTDVAALVAEARADERRAILHELRAFLFGGAA